MVILSYQDWCLLEGQQLNALTDNEKKAALLLTKLDTVSSHTAHGEYSKNLKDNSVDQIKLQIDALVKKEPHVKDFVDLITLKKAMNTTQDKITIERGKTEPDNTKLSQLNKELQAQKAKYQLTSADYYKNKK